MAKKRYAVLIYDQRTAVGPLEHEWQVDLIVRNGQTYEKWRGRLEKIELVEPDQFQKEFAL